MKKTLFNKLKKGTNYTIISDRDVMYEKVRDLVDMYSIKYGTKKIYFADNFFTFDFTARVDKWDIMKSLEMTFGYSNVKSISNNVIYISNKEEA